ncbi:MAG: LicD family protein [Coriobacteriales bacterium]
MSNGEDKYVLHTSEDGTEFYLSKEYGLADLQRTQDRSVEMMKVIVDIFEKNCIDYCLAHGTLLGLVRHGDFIPWDDDVDLFVFDNDYARAIQALRRFLPQDMVVHNKRVDPIYWPPWTKIRDVGSDTYESLWVIDRRMKYHGICVDILHVTPARKLPKQEDETGKRGGLRGLFSKKEPEPQAMAADEEQRDYEPLGFGEYPSVGQGLTCIANMDTVIECTFDYDDVFPTKKAVFRGIEVAVPNNPDGVLSSMYGDYMRLPDLEDRKPHFDRVTFFDDVQNESE